MKDDSLIKKETLEKLETGIRSLFDSEKYKEYLRTLSKFSSYSYRNSILIYLQKPDAICVAGFRAWQTKFGRNVNKGEKGIKILAPRIYKEEAKDANGSIQEIERISFGITTVFDVSQTSGKPINLNPFTVASLNEQVEDFEIYKKALINCTPLPVTYEKIDGDAKGYFRFVDTAERGGFIFLTARVNLHSLVHLSTKSLILDFTTELKRMGKFIMPLP